jgi:ribosome-binding factor A
MNIKVKRLSNEILQVIATYLRKDRKFSLCTVTKVELSPDLGQAKVYWDTFDTAKKDELAALLGHILPKLRSAIAKELPSRHTPVLTLAYDSRFEDSNHIDILLKGNE